MTRERTVSGQGGFTLVELLVVMLIIGILAAIAVPAFFRQQDKARDASAKGSVRAAATAIESFATDNDGSYAGVAVADLVAIETTLGAADLTVVSALDSVYELRAGSPTGNTFTISREADGTSELTCTALGNAGCPADGTWG